MIYLSFSLYSSIGNVFPNNMTIEKGLTSKISGLIFNDVLQGYILCISMIPPAKIFEVYNTKRCIFKAFFPLFSSLFLSLFYFFSLTLQFHFFSPASHFFPPPYHSILENIYPCFKVRELYPYSFYLQMFLSGFGSSTSSSSSSSCTAEAAIFFSFSTDNN